MTSMVVLVILQQLHVTFFKFDIVKSLKMKFLSVLLIQSMALSICIAPKYYINTKICRVTQTSEIFINIENFKF